MVFLKYAFLTRTGNRACYTSILTIFKGSCVTHVLYCSLHVNLITLPVEILLSVLRLM